MNTPIDRRTFLKSSAAGLTLAFSVDIASVATPARAQANASLKPNMWLTIAPDGTITIVSPVAELGQGTTTTLAAVLADDLDADWAHIRTVMPDWNDEAYGNPFWGDDQRSKPRAHDFNTTASYATRGYFMPMRIAGAQARRVLLQAAAHEWGVPVAELATEPSVEEAGGRSRHRFRRGRAGPHWGGGACVAANLAAGSRFGSRKGPEF